MKRISVFLIVMVLFAGFSAKSQEGASTIGPNYSGLENKMKKSDADIQDPKKNTKAKTWTSRADVMIDIYNVHNDKLSVGMNQMLVKASMKEPKEVQTMMDGSDKIEIFVYEWVNVKFVNGEVVDWTDTKKIHPDALGEAAKAIDEAVKLNTDGKADADILKSAVKLKTALADAGSLAFDAKDYKTAYESFVKTESLTELPQLKAAADTMDKYYIYYAGRSALENKDYKEAIRLFNAASANKLENPFIYVYQKQSYFGLGDTAAGVKILQTGFNKYPENQAVMIELINYYLLSNKSDEALKMIQVAKAGDPTNASYSFTEATLYDKTGRYDEAEGLYKEAIGKREDYFDANYNLGILYYNKAVRYYDEAAKIANVTEFEKVQQKGNDELAKSIPYMVKASEIDPTEKSTLTILRQIYYRLKMDNEYNEIVKRINAL